MTYNGVCVFLGKKRRLTVIECNNDINSMIDIAKVADLVRINVLVYAENSETAYAVLY